MLTGAELAQIAQDNRMGDFVGRHTIAMLVQHIEEQAELLRETREERDALVEQIAVLNDQLRQAQAERDEERAEAEHWYTRTYVEQEKCARLQADVARLRSCVSDVIPVLEGAYENDVHGAFEDLIDRLRAVLTEVATSEQAGG